MDSVVTIGIIGDYYANRSPHTVTNAAIEHAARHLSLKAGVSWLPTLSLLTREGQEKLGQFDAIWVSAGGPYKSMEGALQGIRLVRETDRPFIAT